MIRTLFQVALVSLLIGVCAWSATPAELDLQGTVASAVSDVNARAFVLCNVRSAIWGAYDATVEVEAAYTPDKKPRLFQVRAGRVSVVDAVLNGNTRASRAGLVKFANNEDAFAKEVPFFISDARFQAPDSLSFVVWSNPSMTIEGAQPRFELVLHGESGYTSTI